MKIQANDINAKLAKLSSPNSKSETQINSRAHHRGSNRMAAMMRVAPLCHLLVLLATSAQAAHFWANNLRSTNDIEYFGSRQITNDDRIFNHQNSRLKRHPKSSAALPEFSAPIGNVTAVLGRDVRLICQIENLGQYQVSKNRVENLYIRDILSGRSKSISAQTIFNEPTCIRLTMMQPVAG